MTQIRQSRQSIMLLQALQAQVPDVRRVLELIDLRVSIVKHKELEHIVSRFTHPTCLITIGILTTCFVFQSPKRWSYDVVRIDTETTYEHIGHKALKEQILNTINCTDYIQKPLYNKIVFIDNMRSLSGIIGYRISNRTMTLEGDMFHKMQNIRHLKFNSVLEKFLQTRDYEN